MKKKIFTAVFSVLLAGLLAVSCGKADFLEGTVWTTKLDDESVAELYFTSREDCRLVFGSGAGGATLDGLYTGKGNNIYIEFISPLGSYAIGVIDGFDKMKLEWGNARTKYTFKKKKL